MDCLRIAGVVGTFAFMTVLKINAQSRIEPSGDATSTVFSIVDFGAKSLGYHLCDTSIKEAIDSAAAKQQQSVV